MFKYTLCPPWEKVGVKSVWKSSFGTVHGSAQLIPVIGTHNERPE
jgi:hypothetical protein